MENDDNVALRSWWTNVRVGGVGGCYGPSDFERTSKQLQGYAKRHYTRDEIDALCVNRPVDVLLVHDPPAGICSRFSQVRVAAAAPAFDIFL